MGRVLCILMQRMHKIKNSNNARPYSLKKNQYIISEMKSNYNLLNKGQQNRIRVQNTIFSQN
jgi:hypothetical protein